MQLPVCKAAIRLPPRRLEISVFTRVNNLRHNLRYYPGICMQGLRKTKKTPNPDSKSTGRDLNSGNPEQEAGDRGGWCSGNVLQLYFGATLFESRPGHRLSWLKFFALFLTPPCKCRYKTSIGLRPIFSNLSFISHLTIRRYSVSILTAS
jgi:hypothetical protein